MHKRKRAPNPKSFGKKRQRRMPRGLEPNTLTSMSIRKSENPFSGINIKKFLQDGNIFFMKGARFINVVATNVSATLEKPKVAEAIRGSNFGPDVDAAKQDLGRLNRAVQDAYEIQGEVNAMSIAIIDGIPVDPETSVPHPVVIQDDTPDVPIVDIAAHPIPEQAIPTPPPILEAGLPPPAPPPKVGFIDDIQGGFFNLRPVVRQAHAERPPQNDLMSGIQAKIDARRRYMGQDISDNDQDFDDW